MVDQKNPEKVSESPSEKPSEDRAILKESVEAGSEWERESQRVALATRKGEAQLDEHVRENLPSEIKEKVQMASDEFGEEPSIDDVETVTKRDGKIVATLAFVQPYARTA